MRHRKHQEEWTGQLRMVPGPKLIEAEKDVLKQIQLGLAAHGVMALRNNVGAIKKGSRFIRYGLAVGSSDLICVVKPWGRLCGIETKRPKGGVITKQQKDWIAAVRAHGGVAGIATNLEQALALVEEARVLPCSG